MHRNFTLANLHWLVFEWCGSVKKCGRESKSKNCSKSCSIFQNFSVCKKSGVKCCIEWSVNGANRMKTLPVRANPKSVQKVVQSPKIEKLESFPECRTAIPTIWHVNGENRLKTDGAVTIFVSPHHLAKISRQKVRIVYSKLQKSKNQNLQKIRIADLHWTNFEWRKSDENSARESKSKICSITLEVF